MRVATFNILHGQTVGDGVVDPDRLRLAVEALDADVLGLQEVDLRQSRSDGVDQTALAAEAMGATWARFVPAIHGTPGQSWAAARDTDIPSGAAYGVALLSRLPVRDWRAFRLPALPLRAPVRTQDRRWVLTRDEPRAAVAAVVETDFGPVTVATTHLSFVPGWNVAQLRQLLSGLRSLPSPRVLTGDLNMPGNLPRALAAWRRLAQATTYPAHAPRVQLDHVLGLGELPPVRSCDTPELPLSDHRALVVDVG